MVARSRGFGSLHRITGWVAKLTGAVLAAGLAVSPAMAADDSADIAKRVQDQLAAPVIDTTSSEGDANFRDLFNGWKALDNREIGKVSIPSRRPVDNFKLTSQYGYREDPFAGRRARHKGLDMAGPIGTPIYATADGIVGRAQWVNGYGEYIEINHGGDIQTRYGHLSQILVQPNQRVTKGQVIGLMGSTGRSTGSHLHYEVRIAGNSVNPMPFITSKDYLLAMQERDHVAQGGPKE